MTVMTLASESVAARFEKELLGRRRKGKPVNIYFSVDLVGNKVDAQRLKTPLELQSPCDEKAEGEAVKRIWLAIERANTPASLVDLGARRHNVRPLKSSSHTQLQDLSTS